MGNPNNPSVHPYVDQVQLAHGDDHDKLTLRVEVSDFGPSGGYVEVSGTASQVGGALAIISQTIAVPRDAETEGEDAGHWFVDVEAEGIGQNRFRKDQNITVFVRVARVWLTVLGKAPAPVLSTNVEGALDPGETWDLVRADARYTGTTSPSPGALS